MAAIFERLAFLENRLAQMDEEFSREDVEALRAAASRSGIAANGLGGEDRALDEQGCGE
jgi:hypothetical protein